MNFFQHFFSIAYIWEFINWTCGCESFFQDTPTSTLSSHNNAKNFLIINICRVPRFSLSRSKRFFLCLNYRALNKTIIIIITFFWMNVHSCHRIVNIIFALFAFIKWIPKPDTYIECRNCTIFLEYTIFLFL